jgi:hypothetical protein
MTGIPGSPPDLRNPPAGCPFHPRCGYVMERCGTELPPLRPLVRPGALIQRSAACWLQDGTAPPPAELARPEPGPGPSVGTPSTPVGAPSSEGGAA